MRISEGNAVISEALSRPGPTHSVWDLLAAAVKLLARGPRVALLGFAAGGLIAPLRAMGWSGPVEAVDFDPRGERLFRRLASAWCGAVHFSHMEAGQWLSTRRERFDVIIDDLSVPDGDGVTKPAISIDRLPELIRSRLAPDGVALVNTLALRGMVWEEQTRRLAGSHGEARVVLFEEYENRVLILGRELPAARELSLGLRRSLRGIDSRLADHLAVRLWRNTRDS